MAVRSSDVRQLTDLELMSHLFRRAGFSARRGGPSYDASRGALLPSLDLSLRRLGVVRRRRHEYDQAIALCQRSYEIAIARNDGLLAAEALRIRPRAFGATRGRVPRRPGARRRSRRRSSRYLCRSESSGGR